MKSFALKVSGWIHRNDVLPDSGSESLFRMFAVFGTGKLVASVLGMVGGLLTARVTSPEVLGSFRALGLVGGYVNFLQVGVLNGLGRELPYCIGMGEREEGERLASSARVWSLAVGSLVTLGLLGVAIWHVVQGNIRSFVKVTPLTWQREPASGGEVAQTAH